MKINLDLSRPLNSNIEVGDSESMNGHYVLFNNENLLINYGTCFVTAEFGRGASWYTGNSTNIRDGEFAKPFGHIYTLTCSLAAGDWSTIVNQSASNTGIERIVLSYDTGYTQREFRIDYIAIGRIV